VARDFSPDTDGKDNNNSENTQSLQNFFCSFNPR